ncbi:mycothiol synthase [Corynebacterium sp. 3HC-13]|uniref:mycothiol synthase n=1 Tax=Corynebacterium poyangense TaxID=2684405 RepID=UPI001CCD66CF|nr:mycothiol synthase [Corynebacterium poyangense]MBZ8176369.1 mycothiol synthase [Corynebacterium poyangense]
MISQEQHRQIHHLLEQIASVDGIEPLSEHFLNGIADPSLGHRHFIRWENSVPIAIAALDVDQVELSVHPEFRGRGIGRGLIEEIRDAQPQAQFWAHGNCAAAQHLAANYGYSVIRELLVMTLSEEHLAKESEVSIPAGFFATTLSEAQRRWSSESVEDAWLAVNNEAFSWHPEQGGWDRQRLHRAQQVEWFNPDDVFFLWEENSSSQTPPLAGFHWTKWHGGADAVGEVYVVGLSPRFQGKKLGTPLLALGIRRIFLDHHAKKIILYVESDNEAAVGLYRARGFSVSEQHTVYGITS